jgi:intracellular sulfur oxidation DsrE/DsrF family protein
MNAGSGRAALRYINEAGYPAYHDVQTTRWLRCRDGERAIVISRQLVRRPDTRCTSRRILMNTTLYIRLLPVLLLVFPLMAAQSAETGAPWGRASPEEVDYAPQKVLYDVAVSDVDSFSRVLDRVSYLNNLYNANPFEASIVMVLHGDEIPFFAVDNYAEYRELMERARSLTVAGPVEFRVCRVAARGHGLEPGDLHGFVQVVPMADAEIVSLQQEEGYAYMQ